MEISFILFDLSKRICRVFSIVSKINLRKFSTFYNSNISFNLNEAVIKCNGINKNKIKIINEGEELN